MQATCDQMFHNIYFAQNSHLATIRMITNHDEAVRKQALLLIYTM